MKRYPGIRPFTAQDQHLFYGRDKEERDLFQMVILNDIVVLFGKSGTGKSSLLNAGVCPQFENRNLHPVFIRLNNINLSPEQQVYEYLQEHNYIPKSLAKDLSLWEYFKHFWYVDLGEIYTPVIIFDQFEELFTLYTHEERKDFIDQFADLINDRMPASLQQKIKDPLVILDNEVDWETPPKVKFILSIRSDYLYLLDELSTDIPSILRTRFQLNMLNRSNAIQAITLPAVAAGQFDSPAFEYEQDSIDEIIEVLGKKERDRLRSELPDTEPEIEAFQLQLFCQQVENKIIKENRSTGFKVQPDFYKGKSGIQKIIGAFYSDVISRIPSAHQVAVEALVATFLIRNNRRIIMEESAIIEESGITIELLNQLHEERLLRKEARTGSFYYEISHDTLIKPILDKYEDIAIRLEEEKIEQERLAKEKRLAAIKQKEEAEKERKRAEEQMQLRKRAEKSANRAKKLTMFALLAFIFAIVLAGFALKYYQDSKESFNNLELLNLVEILDQTNVIQTTDQSITELRRHVQETKAIDSRLKVIEYIRDSTSLMPIKGHDEFSVDAMLLLGELYDVIKYDNDLEPIAQKAIDLGEKAWNSTHFRQYPQIYTLLTETLQAYNAKDSILGSYLVKNNKSTINAIASNSSVANEFAIGTSDGRVRLLPDKNKSASRQDRILALHFVKRGNQDNLLVSSYSRNPSIIKYIVDKDTLKRDAVRMEFDENIYSLNSYNNGKDIIAASRNHIYTFSSDLNLRTKKEIKSFYNANSILVESVGKIDKSLYEVINNDIYAISVGEQENLLLVGKLGVTEIYEIKGNKFVEKPSIWHPGIKITQIAIKGDQLAFGSETGEIWVRKWDDSAKIEIRNDNYTKKHDSTITGLAFNESLHQLASSSIDGNIWLWNLEDIDRNLDHIRLETERNGVQQLVFEILPVTRSSEF